MSTRRLISPPSAAPIGIVNCGGIGVDIIRERKESFLNGRGWMPPAVLLANTVSLPKNLDASSLRALTSSP
jgi:hypothetical protein